MKELKCPYCGHKITSSEHKRIHQQMKLEAEEQYKQATQRLEEVHKKALDEADKKTKRLTAELKGIEERLESQFTEKLDREVKKAKKEAETGYEKLINDKNNELDKYEGKLNKLELENDELIKKHQKDLKTAIQEIERQSKKDLKIFEQRARSAEKLIDKLENQKQKDIDKAVNAALRGANSEIKELEAEHKLKLADLKSDLMDDFETKFDKERNKNKSKIGNLEKEVSKLNRQIESIQAEERGSLKEAEIFGILEQSFRLDIFERVGRGRAGADIIHHVRNRRGDELGKIVYEIKDTQSWQNKFIEKAKTYRKKYETPHIIIVTNAFPKHEQGFTVRDGILIVNKNLVRWIAEILRNSVEEIHASEASQKGIDKKMSQLYSYISSPEFKHGMTSINDSVDSLKDILDKEQTWHRTKWRQQEDQLREIAGLTAEISDKVKIIIQASKDTKLLKLAK
jgi:hypothetical protein